jgi:hypothetical protein
MIASSRLIRIWDRPHRKHRFQQFLYCCVRICCHRNVFGIRLMLRVLPQILRSSSVGITDERVSGGIKYTFVHETCTLHRKPQSIIEYFPSRISSLSQDLTLTRGSLLRSNIFRPRVRKHLYLNTTVTHTEYRDGAEPCLTVTGYNMLHNHFFVSPLPLSVPKL